MAKFPTYKELAEEVAEKVLDEILYKNKSIRQWMALITMSDFIGRWIPVSERLPDENGDYLTTTVNDEVYCDYWNGINFNRTELIIAWCPLPKPYERGIEE